MRNPSVRGHDKTTSAVVVGEPAKILIAEFMSLHGLRTCGNSKH
ncbi:MAG: hypothetical protein OXI53_08540 [Nitrospira sp.]|nr:hypothetical protein [Nitrospira sp.]